MFTHSIRSFLWMALISALGASGVNAATDVIFSDRFQQIDGYVVTVIIQGDGDASPSRRTVPTDTSLSILLKSGEGHRVATVSGCNGDLTDLVYETGPITADCSVTVIFEPNKYTLSFESAGGSAVDPITEDFGTEITAPAAPTREGYTFTGWSPSLPSTMPAQDLTLTAQWQQIKFTLGENGVTIFCPLASIGETGKVGDVTYTRRTRNDITPENAATTCTSGITDFSGLFKGKSDFNEDIGHWDVSQATNFTAMFQGASAFNRDLSQWNTSSVTTLSQMFYEASAFNQDISGWDTSSVGNMSFMFFDAGAFNQNIGSWDTSQVVNMDYMFYLASAFDQDLRAWCVQNINPNPVTIFTFSFGSSMSEDDQPSFGQPCGP